MESPVRRSSLPVLFCILLAGTSLRAQQPTPTESGATPAVASSYRASHAEAIALGRATVRQALAGEIDSLVATADPSATTGGLRERLSAGIAQISMQLGDEVRLLGERVVLVDGRVEYQRTADYAMVPVPLVFRVILGEQGKWRGFTANTVENTPDGEEIKP